MAGRFLPCLAIAACGLLAALPWPAHAQSRAFDDIPRIVCAEGIEPYLPGDYYFCAANKALQAGDPRKAVAMYRESARWGDKRAMFNLGLLLVRGESVAKDEAQGLAWLALAAERPRDALHREVLAGVTDAELTLVAEKTCAPEESIHNEPAEVSPETVLAALKAADAEGRRRQG